MKRLIFSDPITHSTEWVWSQDPALSFLRRGDFKTDEEWVAYHSATFMPIWNEYNETNDLRVLPVREGWELVRWVIGKLTKAQIQAFDGMKEIEEKIARISYGIRDIKGLQDPEGNSIVIDRVDGAYGKCLPEAVLTWIINDPLLREEMYWRVRGGGMLSAGQRKRDLVPVLVPQPADGQG